MTREKREKKGGHRKRSENRKILFCRNEDSYCWFENGVCARCGYPKIEVKGNEVPREKRSASHHGLPKT